MKNILFKALLASALGVSLLAFTNVSSADTWVDPNYHHEHHHHHKHHHCWWTWQHHQRVQHCRWDNDHR